MLDCQTDKKCRTWHVCISFAYMCVFLLHTRRLYPLKLSVLTLLHYLIFAFFYFYIINSMRMPVVLWPSLLLFPHFHYHIYDDTQVLASANHYSWYQSFMNPVLWEKYKAYMIRWFLVITLTQADHHNTSTHRHKIRILESMTNVPFLLYE